MEGKMDGFLRRQCRIEDTMVHPRLWDSNHYNRPSLLFNSVAMNETKFLRAVLEVSVEDPPERIGAILTFDGDCYGTMILLPQTCVLCTSNSFN